jgi:O-antigen biosynthesis protein
MKPYYVSAPQFNLGSAGCVVMHRLAHELRLRGMEVYLSTRLQNPRYEALPVSNDWGHDAASCPHRPGSIAVYPEIVHGNPMGGSVVVRYILNKPGRFGGPASFPETDLLFVYSDFWNRESGLDLPEERVLMIPSWDTDTFFDMRLNREGCLHYRGKGRQPDDPEASRYPSVSEMIRINVGPEGQIKLRETLNRCERLYCYDNATVFAEIARLCGCEIILIPDPQFKGASQPKLPDTRDRSELIRANLWLEMRMQKRLDYFIEITQGAI